MESEETAFRRACYERLRDDAVWNAYMDWLRDQGREQMAERMPVLRKLLRDRLPVAKLLPDEGP